MSSISKSRIKFLIRESILRLILEGLADNIAKKSGLKNENHIENLRKLSDKPYKLNKRELSWLAKWYTSVDGMTDIEPFDHVGKAIISFLKVAKRLSEYNMSTNIEDYNSPGDLRRAYAKTQGLVVAQDLAAESTLVGTYGPWKVYMPHTREASCQLGQGTNWCTAISGRGNNLFYNYVVGSQQHGIPVILYYVIFDDNLSYYSKYQSIQPGMQYRRKPKKYFEKISVGFSHGKIFWPEEHDMSGDGHITVNAGNRGVKKTDFIKEIDNMHQPGTGNVMIQHIENHANSISGIHPAAAKVSAMAKDVAAFKREMRGKSADVKVDTIALVMREKNISSDVMNEIKRVSTSTLESFVRKKLKEFLKSDPDIEDWAVPNRGSYSFQDFLYEILDFDVYIYSPIQEEDLNIYKIHIFLYNPSAITGNLSDQYEANFDLVSKIYDIMLEEGFDLYIPTSKYVEYGDPDQVALSQSGDVRDYALSKAYAESDQVGVLWGSHV